VINALDNAIMGPTYRAGSLRGRALASMRELVERHGVDSVAFELLGPPRLSKLLYEAHLLRKTVKTLQGVLEHSAEELSRMALDLVREDSRLRATILSVGIPILLPDGKLLRGPEIKIPRFIYRDELEITPENLEEWAAGGWVDLRVENFEVWRSRIKAIFEYLEQLPPDDTSSRFVMNRDFWVKDPEINIGKVVGWLFITEEKGLRIKH
jgi:hypothetical protein